jgi:hypothetical protein
MVIHEADRLTAFASGGGTTPFFISTSSSIFDILAMSDTRTPFLADDE